jgi:MFS transporter, FSR family, fosmidomycin resistance protein
VPHVIRQPGLLGGTTLAVFMALVYTVNDAITAILGALLPTLQERFDAGPTLLAVIVAVFWIASSATQPVFGAIAEDVGLRVIASLGVLMAAAFLSLIGVASQLGLVFLLLVIGGLGSAALHPVGTTIAGSQATNATFGVGLFTAGGMVGFALGPVFILYLVSEFGTDATVWFMVSGLVLGAAVWLLLPQWEPHPRRPIRRLFDLQLLRASRCRSGSAITRPRSRSPPTSICSRRPAGRRLPGRPDRPRRQRGGNQRHRDEPKRRRPAGRGKPA